MEKIITFLGTSSMVPTKNRNVQSIHIRIKNANFLIDCGEGTQRQMNIAGINRNKLDAILITHWHADHTSGLTGLLQTRCQIESQTPLKIIGPQGTTEFITHILQSCYFSKRPDIEIIELEKSNVPKEITTIQNMTIKYLSLNHGVPCVAYRLEEEPTTKINIEKLTEKGLTRGPKIGKLQRGHDVEHEGKTLKAKDYTFQKKGHKVCAILDTKYSSNHYKIAKDVDILICESTYDHNLTEKAQEYKHMTGTQAAKIAEKANVKKLLLTHFSQRYSSTKTIENEAKAIFSNTACANDFQQEIL